MTAYMLWLGDNREKIKKPGMSVTDVTKAAGTLWKDVKDKTVNSNWPVVQVLSRLWFMFHRFGRRKLLKQKRNTKRIWLSTRSLVELQLKGLSCVHEFLFFLWLKYFSSAKSSNNASSSSAKKTVSPSKIKSAEYVATSGSSSEEEVKSEAESSEPESD